jgi:hypothetical protein
LLVHLMFVVDSVLNLAFGKSFHNVDQLYRYSYLKNISRYFQMKFDHYNFRKSNHLYYTDLPFVNLDHNNCEHPVCGCEKIIINLENVK